ncbi:hypothetical protein AV521_35230 [Streptomyces sp. IMTB 2501]|nr:hypothetical protein AV521_35230 [Streptomyces sp. IMTB 2501]
MFLRARQHPEQMEAGARPVDLHENVLRDCDVATHIGVPVGAVKSRSHYAQGIRETDGMHKSFLAAGMTLAATLTGCTTALSPTGGPGWNAEAVRESAEQYTSLCADPTGMPGPAGGVPPVAPAVARTGEVSVLAGQTGSGEGDEQPMPALAPVLVFCVYGSSPTLAAPAQVPESPSCPARQVSVVRPRPGVAWAVAADGTPIPFPYPLIGAPGEGDCAPVVDDVQARLWR